jgi:hypothetical protein
MVTLLCALVIASPLSVRAATPTIVQQTSAYFNPSASFGLAFPSAVTSGDVIVVAIDIFTSTSNVVTSVADSFGSSYTEPGVSPSLLAASDGGAYIFYATASSGGADTVTLHTSGMQIGVVYIYEVSGVTTASVTAVAGTSSGGPTSAVATSPAAFSSEGFLIETIQTLDFVSMTPGTGFTAATNPGGEPYGYTEYSTSGVTSPTTFPMTLSLSTQWDAVGVAFASVGGQTNPPPLPAVIPKHFTFNFKNSSSIIGNEVSTWGFGVMYNMPGFNPKVDFYPYAVDICLNPNNSTISISGFFQTGTGGNATELFVYNWGGINTPSAGWPSESACSA